jgi:hypothetical protein
MTMELSDLLGGNMPGLLNSQDQGAVNQQGLMGIASGLLQAAGPSPYKGKLTTLSGIGSALQSGMAARKSAMDDLLKQRYVTAQTAHLNDEQVLKAAQMATNFQANNLPVPPVIQHILDAASGRIGMGGGMPAGAMAQAPNQGQPAPQGAPMQPTGSSQFPPGSPAARLQALGMSPYALAATGPAADIAKAAVEKNITATDPAIEDNERRKKIMESDVARSEKIYPIYDSMGITGHNMLENANLAKGAIADPGFSSGLFAPIQEGWKKLQVALGAGDPKAALAMEVYGKVRAENINEQISEMKEVSSQMGPSGRVFAPQIGLMEKASGNLGNTPEANYFLATMYGRGAQNMVALSDMAHDYKEKHGILDVGFDKQASKYIKDHPVFTPEEYKNVRDAATPAGGSLGSNGPSTAPQPAAPGRYRFDPKTGKMEMVK